MKTTPWHTLAETLRNAAAAYYDTDAVTMSDLDYDDGIERLRIAVAEDPSLGPEFADLLEHVAGGQSTGGDITHTSMMGSMDKVIGIAAVADFVTAVDAPVVVEPKLDGLAIRAQYTGGTLHSVATRGDGTTGEDITAHVRALRICGLPEKLAQDLTLEVRGEVYVGDAAFERANSVRTGSGAAAFVNPRNAAAGILRKGDAAYAGVLAFAAYEAHIEGAEPASHGARLALVAATGVTTVHGLVQSLEDTPTCDPAAVTARVALLGEHRGDLGFPIDGAIVKADDDATRTALGYGSRSPKWAIAFKYEAESATTVVRDITWTVGRTGRLAIRIEVDPVFVGGTTVTFASGHNVNWMGERDVRVGDTVTIRRAGDVIPYIGDVDLAARPADSVRWEPPAVDPLGNEWDKSTLLWRSTSPELSIAEQVLYAASRDCLDIEGLGTEVATALVELGYVSSIADLFDLTIDQLTTLTMGGRNLGESNGRKIHAQIEQSKQVPWNRVITALGLRGTGRTMGRRLAAALPTMQRLQSASVDNLAAIDGIGLLKAELIHSELRRVEAAGVLDRLAAAGVAMGTEPDPAELANRPLAGMTVVVSGAVPGLTRGEISEVIEAAGGKASSSVSKATSLLVSEPSTSSKYVKATDLGVRIVTPTEFLAMIGRDQ